MPVPDLSNVASPQNLSSPSQSLYMDMGMVMMPKKGGPSRWRDRREHREYKRDKARGYSRSTRPLGANIAQRSSSIRRVAKALRSHPRGSQKRIHHRY